VFDNVISRCLGDLDFSLSQELLDEAPSHIWLLLDRWSFNSPFLRYGGEDFLSLSFRFFLPGAHGDWSSDSYVSDESQHSKEGRAGYVILDIGA
jgi:hypothetical protein